MMDASDPARVAYVNYLARCEQAFRPFAPIDLPEFFAGRAEHVRRLDAEVSAPGRHVAIFGERGVGKTSLAQLAYFFLRRNEEDTHFVRCERTSSFDSIFTDILASAGIEVTLNGVEAESQQHGALGVAALSLGASRRLHRTFRRIAGGRQITARLLLEHFGDRDGLVIVDEYDRVTDSATHTRLAELIKHFSDAAARTKIIVVGVADTLTQLIGEHESLTRSLAQIRLDRMTDEELGDIIDKGASFLNARFKADVRRRIARLADGFPYFVHLIGRHTARAAGQQILRDAKASVVAADEEYAHGLREALINVESTLAHQYEEATVTTRRPSEKFTLILWAMGLAEARDVQVQDIAKNASFFTGAEVKAASLSWNLGELSEKRERVLTKVREGYYKFTNPLMRPYIRSLMELENVMYRGKQWELPFMRSA